MQGGVKITRGQNQMNGDYAEVDLVTGVSRLMSSGSGVKGMILPNATAEDSETSPKVQ